jgi:hypothetical protein
MFGSLAFGELRAEAENLKFEVQLLWGTNDKKSSDDKHKPVEADIARKLKDLPLKWTNYFVVNQKSFQVAPSSTEKVPLSEKCALEVRNRGGSLIEVTHIGQGKEVWKGTQSLPKGEILVLGGNAPKATSWLVVLKRVN